MLELEQEVYSCGTLLSTPPHGGFDNKMPQLHATQSEFLDYINV